MKLPIPAAAVGFLALLFLDVQAGVAADKVLYSFQGGSDGNGPLSPLITDGKGNLYGTTIGGGGSVCYGADPPGCGTVFKLTRNHEEKLLYAFGGGNDGAYPEGGLISDQAGNLYGTTVGGGGAEGGTSTVFKLSSKGTKTILHTFQMWC